MVVLTKPLSPCTVDLRVDKRSNQWSHDRTHRWARSRPRSALEEKTMATEGEAGAGQWPPPALARCRAHGIDRT